jgi:uncharacterized membrane protein YfhO
VIEGASERPDRLSLRATPAVFRISTDTHVELSFDAARAGWLVLADSFYPGWSASLDGHAVSIHAANVAFRAVRVPSGSHRVVFSYAPTDETVAAWLSGVAFLATAGLLLALGRKRRFDPDSGGVVAGADGA